MLSPTSPASSPVMMLPPTSPVMTGRMTAGTSKNGRAIGPCCITGCTFSLELVHHCHVCKRFVHMTCAEPFNNLSEDERYCDTCISKVK